MKLNTSFNLLLSLSFTATWVSAQSGTLEMPMIGQRLPVAGLQFVNRIPRSHLEQLPKVLPVYRYSSMPTCFPAGALQALLDKSAFAGTNIVTLLGGRTNTASVSEPIRLATVRGLDYFLVAPSTGAIVVQNHSRNPNPPPDAVPSFDAVREQVLRYARSFGISTNDMDKVDGAIHPQRTEDKVTRMGGAVRFIARRSARFSRSIDGHTLLANDDRIELALGPDGCLLKFDLKWPDIAAVRTNRLFTPDQLVAAIKAGNVLADVSNDYPSDGVSQIILKDIHVDYYAFSPRGFGSVSTNADIFPVASIFAVFTSKSGKTQEGGLYAPLCASQ